jgi:hypothetical protein
MPAPAMVIVIRGAFDLSENFDGATTLPKELLSESCRYTKRRS